MILSRKKYAFTLVELLIAMSLTVLVGGVLYLLQSSGLSTVRRGTTQLTLTSLIRNKLEKMTSELRCAKEIIAISPSSIKFRCYHYSQEHQEPGDTSLETITYEVTENGKREVLWKTVNRGNPTKLISVKSINKDIFYPYFRGRDRSSKVGWSFIPFDMVSNDSGQRKRIVFIRIKLSLSERRDSVTLTTAVALQPAASIVEQPHWKYR